jgi:hypothetical protein
MLGNRDEFTRTDKRLLSIETNGWLLFAGTGFCEGSELGGRRSRLALEEGGTADVFLVGVGALGLIGSVAVVGGMDGVATPDEVFVLGAMPLFPLSVSSVRVVGLEEGSAWC